MDGAAGHGGEPADAPITPGLLAELQAGLLDDATAARLRHRARTDPDAAGQLAALDRIRRDLARLGADESSAPAVPAAVTARVGAALQAAHHPRLDHQVVGDTPSGAAAHSLRRSVPRLRRLQLLAGLCAAVLAAGLGALMLVRPPSQAPSAGPTAELITVPPPRDFPLSETQVIGLLSASPDYGPLGDPLRRAGCLNGLGYPTSTSVLGARPVDVHGRPGVLMVLPGDTPAALVALVVALNCSSADTGLLAETLVRRP